MQNEVINEISPIDNVRTLRSIEHAIQMIDMVRMGKKPEDKELSLCVGELRNVRVEHLKEIG